MMLKILLNLLLRNLFPRDESIEIEINYLIKLPDSKFTGYGYDDDNFYLKNWIIVFSNIYDSRMVKSK